MLTCAQKDAWVTGSKYFPRVHHYQHESTRLTDFLWDLKMFVALCMFWLAFWKLKRCLEALEDFSGVQCAWVDIYIVLRGGIILKDKDF